MRRKDQIIFSNVKERLVLDLKYLEMGTKQ